MRTLLANTLLLAAALGMAHPAHAQAFGPRELTAQSKQCIACHRQHSPALYQQWGASKHYRANVGCFECHGANKGEPDAYEHNGQTIAVLVTPKDCARCHSKEVEEFSGSHHAKAGRILGAPDSMLAEVVAGNHGMKTHGFPHGASADAVTGCWQCHGSEVKVLPDGKLDPATWPNSGIGRINPDGSEGSCSACHSRHTFSVAEARQPDTCGKCHVGPAHAQKEIYESSRHGTNFIANLGRMNLDNNKWVVGEDYWDAPTCATCHMSATRKQPITHDVGLRISWNNRPELSVRPEIADARLGLPGARVPWQTRRQNMTDVCINCHDTQWVGNFYTQYDALIDLYNQKFAAPGKELFDLSRPLANAAHFSSEVDWTWYEIWRHAGRRARHGAAMMSPVYAHSYGMHEVARKFYSEYIPQLEALVEKHSASPEPARAEAARALKDKLAEVLARDDHKWYRGQVDPAEAARRTRAPEEFSERDEKK